MIKHTVFALFLMSAVSFALGETAYHIEFTQQLDCTTLKVAEKAGPESGDKLAAQEAANACVPVEFVVDMADVLPNFVAGTREDRLQAIAEVTVTRLSLCRGMGYSGWQLSAKCVPIFLKSRPPAPKDS